MLVLSRKAGQRVFIGDDIVVEVRRVAGNRVTLALEAPRDVRILRSELQQAATEFEIELPEEDAPHPVAVVRSQPGAFHMVHSHGPAASELVG